MPQLLDDTSSSYIRVKFVNCLSYAIMCDLESIPKLPSVDNNRAVRRDLKKMYQDKNMSLSCRNWTLRYRKRHSMDKTIETTISAGAKITPNVAFGKERGWTLEI